MFTGLGRFSTDFCVILFLFLFRSRDLILRAALPSYAELKVPFILFIRDLIFNLELGDILSCSNFL
jgi:hypothetical protein